MNNKEWSELREALRKKYGNIRYYNDKRKNHRRIKFYVSDWKQEGTKNIKAFCKRKGFVVSEHVWVSTYHPHRTTVDVPCFVAEFPLHYEYKIFNSKRKKIPQDIAQIAYQRSIKDRQDRLKKGEAIRLDCLFIFNETPEHRIWYDVDEGNYESFYDFHNIKEAK